MFPYCSWYLIWAVLSVFAKDLRVQVPVSDEDVRWNMVIQAPVHVSQYLVSGDGLWIELMVKQVQESSVLVLSHPHWISNHNLSTKITAKASEGAELDISTNDWKFEWVEAGLSARIDHVVARNESTWFIQGHDLGISSDDLVSVQIDGLTCRSWRWISASLIECQLGELDLIRWPRPIISITTRSGGTVHSATNMASSQSPKPFIRSVSPSNGPLLALTTVTIKGQFLGMSKEDIYDVGIVINDKNIPLDSDASRVASPHLSCLWTTQFIDSSTLKCKVSAQHGGYRTENGTINRSARWDIEGGYVYVHTRSGGVGINRKALFLFSRGCSIAASENGCLKRGCAWCAYNTQCVNDTKDCVENCSTLQVQMTCAERTGIIIVSCFIGVLIVLLVWFIHHRNQLLREDLNYKLFGSRSPLNIRIPRGRAQKGDIQSEFEDHADSPSSPYRESERSYEKFIIPRLQPKPCTVSHQLQSSIPSDHSHSTINARTLRGLPSSFRRQHLQHLYQAELDRKHEVLKQPNQLSSFF